MKKVLLLDENHPVLKKGLEDLGYHCDIDYDAEKEGVEDYVEQYVGLVIRSRFKIDKAFIDKAVNLKFIARVGAGLESIDVEYAKKKGITLIAAPEGNRNAVGEHALGMLLSLMNNFNKADKEIREGKWLREVNRGVELEGKTVGIIGYGNMGKSFARKLQGFNVELLCYDIKEGVGDSFCKQVSLEELKSKADIVSMHTPHNNLSYKMVDKGFIESFRKSFYFINTARGTAVVTDDLVLGLKRGKILAAGLDVLEYEKLSFQNFFDDNKLPEAFQYLIQADNVLLTPHIAGWTQESRLKLAQTIVKKIRALIF